MKTSPALISIVVAITVAGLVALAGSQGGLELSGWPVFGLCVALAFAIQWVAFVPAFILQTEHFFDLTGSLTYLTVSAVAVAYGNQDARALLLLALVAIWAVRLGSFLFLRIRRAGSDRRFNSIKPHAATFLMTWILQGLWVSLTLACALAAMTSERTVPMGPVAIVGALVWSLGFAFEVVADRQKTEFRLQPENKGNFITSGLWAWSRHPNYFGEILLWIGIAIIALPVLVGWQLVTLISPLFVWVLLTRISGVRMLEAHGKKKWGDDPAYQVYRSQTPALWPRKPKSLG